MKSIRKNRKILIFVLIIGLIITITPILGTQIHRIVKKNSLTLGYYKIVSVECTDEFGYPITLYVKPSLGIEYQRFPEIIIPFEQAIYIDNETDYLCYGIGKYKRSVFTFTFDLDIKVKQDGNSQKIDFTAIAIKDNFLFSETFWFGELGGELLITFYLHSWAR